MTAVRTVMITGATSGLGLAMARSFAKVGNWRLVLAVRDLDAGTAVCRELGPKARAVHVDMADARSVADLASAWTGPLHALVNNAGGQFHGPTAYSPQAVERTLALNALGPLQLTLGLLHALRWGTVLNIGSGTHNPHDRGARMFGFRGGRFSSIARLAAGEADAQSGRRAALDRYA
ncbi:SDR family NAD(P)-dependent oxidoreductase, partial [Nostoc sp. NIES-2111]